MGTASSFDAVASTNDWVREVGGDDVHVTELVGPGGDAHTYEPTPADAAALAKAQLIFENGLGFETWLDRLCESSGARARRIVTTRTLKPLEHVVAPGVIEIDPHVWHSPANAQAMVREIAAALTEADPSNAAEYERRSQNYCMQLDELDRWIRQESASYRGGNSNERSLLAHSLKRPICFSWTSR